MSTLGSNWGPVWQSGVWNNDIWSQPAAGVSPGRIWGQIWQSGVWATGVWATEPSILPIILYPESVISNFEWVTVGGNIADILRDMSDLTYIATNQTGARIIFALTEAPSYTTITGATLRIRLKQV